MLESEFVTIAFNVPETHSETVTEAIKKTHPYEEMVIDIFPIYQIGMKQQ
ncbi:MAG: hypothetical protein KDK65_02485 [Chlamydiia bacterium]|nr:hypothetical protein [Chlamydiia bacterium]